MSVRARGFPRRKRPSLLARLRVYWIFWLAAFAALVYGGYVLVTLPQLRVRDVRVSVDGRRVQARDILAAARIDRDANAWLVSTRRVAERIEALPYVDRARVTHEAPAGIAIAVSERVPAACVRAGTRVVTVDAAQRILQDGCAAPNVARIDLGQARLGAPGAFVTDPALAQLTADVKTLADGNVRVRALGRDRFGGLLATDDRGIELRLGGEADLAAKAALVEPVRAAAGHGRRIRAIDLRAPGTPVVEFAGDGSR